MHKNFTLLAKHSLLDITEKTQIKTTKNEEENVESRETEDVGMLQVPTERCLKHPAKVVDMYCKTHDDVGCSVCFIPHYK
jgi:hypothetical protein